jgi:hypothetical protein
MKLHSQMRKSIVDWMMRHPQERRSWFDWIPPRGVSWFRWWRRTWPLKRKQAHRHGGRLVCEVARSQSVPQVRGAMPAAEPASSEPGHDRQ